jgi:hypothetical protein
VLALGVGNTTVQKRSDGVDPFNDPSGKRRAEQNEKRAEGSNLSRDVVCDLR